MTKLRIKIAYVRLAVYTLKRLNFLPSLIKNNISEYISSLIYQITDEMCQKQLL